MTPSRSKRIRLAVAIGTCALALFLAPIAQRAALAAPQAQMDDGARAGRPVSVDLRLNRVTATRVMAQEGAAQADDGEKPKSMEEKAKDAPNPNAAAAAKAEPVPEDKFAFVKDWPFWVIVGGAVLLLGGGYYLLSNSNQKPPCDMQEFPGGCFP